MSEKLVASQTCVKSVIDGYVQFRYGEPLSKRDIALLGSKYDDCRASGLLITKAELEERRAYLDQAEALRRDPSAANDLYGTPSATAEAAAKRG